MELIITDNLTEKNIKGTFAFQIVSLRVLTKAELDIIKKYNLRRFYLPQLSRDDSEKFFLEFDAFWDEVAKQFSENHPFWRSAVSSKMQGWDNSVANLCLILFTLLHMKESDTAKIIIICDCVETEQICAAWAKLYRWKTRIMPRFRLSYTIRLILQKIHNIWWALQRLGLCLSRKWVLRQSCPHIYSGDESTLLLSLFYPSSFENGLYKDPFLGSLHRSLAAIGQKCVYLCEPLGSLNRSLAKAIVNCSEVSVFTSYSLVGWWELLRIAIKLYFRRIRISKSAFLGCDFSKLLEWQAHCFRDSFNLNAELIYFATSNLCKINELKKLICSYEGNVQERACIQAYREHCTENIIGYSQAIIFPLNLKLRMTSREANSKPEPGKIVCTGPYAKELLQRVGKRDPSTLYDGCSIRNIAAIKPRDKPSKQHILVAFDAVGIVSSSILLEWLFESAGWFGDISVLLRFHPNLPAKTMLNQCSITMPGNFKVSDGDLSRDIKNSICVLYRHSSVGLQAVLNGIPAFYLAINSPLSGDPMEELDAFKWIIREPNELTLVFKKIESIGLKERHDLQIRAQEFSTKYFSAPNSENMKVFEQR